MSKWIGYAVSVNCGEPLGCYQGTILEADGNTITLTKAFRNGFPYPKSQVTLNAADIKELRIIESRASPPAHSHSTVAVSKNKKGHRSTVCENLQANPSSSAIAAGNQAASNVSGNKPASARGPPAPAPAPAPAAGAVPAPTPPRSKPIDIQATRNNKNTHNGSYPHPGSTPKARGSGPGPGNQGGGPVGGGVGGGHDKARRRNEACFGQAAEVALDHDFDFEGNLALFDKRALWEQMNNAHKPDLVRQTDDMIKYRHDENVLGGETRQAVGARRRCGIVLPAGGEAPARYLTDEGVEVPAAGAALRGALWAALRRHALADGARLLLARAAADLALRLVGGGRRLDPSNAHQTPVAVAVCGAHSAGAAGLGAARLLASHGVRVACHVAARPQPACEPVARELEALALCGVEPCDALRALPRPDLVLLALHDPEQDEHQSIYSEALQWASSARAVVVVMEPPDGEDPAWSQLSARACVCGLLPGTPAPALGRLWLADVAPPPRLLRALGVTYRPPFGASSVIALHPTEL